VKAGLVFGGVGIVMGWAEFGPYSIVKTQD